jgi:hypothetical protein
LTSQEVYISSFTGYLLGGNNYSTLTNTNNYINTIVGAATASGTYYSTIFTTPGFFNIPICYTDDSDVEPSTFFDHLSAPNSHTQSPYRYV